MLDAALRREANFRGRMQALDRLEFAEGPEAESLRRQMEVLNEGLFQGLREKIRAGVIPDFRTLLWEYAGHPEVGDEAGYDNLDVFLNGIFSSGMIPTETKALEPDMVFYQKTPGRVVLELVDRAGFTDKDVFYDLGSGLGQVPMLVNLLSGVKAKGVELEPAYILYSEQAAAGLGLGKVSFLEADVREAELSDGTAFFLYTPFTGKMLAEVLEKLGRLAARTSIRLFTYGPCTGEIFKARGWIWENPEPPEVFKLGAFTLR